MVKLEPLENLCYVLTGKGVENESAVMYYDGSKSWTYDLNEAHVFNSLSAATRTVKTIRKAWDEFPGVHDVVKVDVELIHKKKVMLARLKG
jgi:hypothetical protein